MLTLDETDYIRIEGSLTFEANSSSGTLECTSVPIVDDELKEENESFIFVISSSDDAVRLDVTTTDIHITDDDGVYR